MSNASLQLGGGNFAVKDGKLLGYATDPKTSVFVSREFDFSRGSNLAATRVDANGLIEKGRENLLTYSNTFSSWSFTTGSSVTGGQSGYDGTNDAWILTDSGYTGSYAMYNTINNTGILTASIYAKAASTSEIELDFFGSPNPAIKVDLISGNITAVSGHIDAKSVDVGNGWYRISLTGNISSLLYIRIGCDGAGSIYIQDAQLEAGLVATDYIETGATTAQAGILEDMPRIDYTNSSSPALLLEPQRTNLLRHSEYLDGWTSLGSPVITTNYGISPDGLRNSTRFVAVSGDRKYMALSLASSTYTYSLYVKGTGSLVLTDNSGSYSLDITPTSEWVRYDYSMTTSLSNVQIRTYSSCDVEIWGIQLEAGSYPTSYIPTYGSEVTRNADSCSKTGVSSLIGQTEGTLFLEAEAQSGFKTFSICDGATSNRITIVHEPPVSFRIIPVYGGVVGTQISTSYTSGNAKIAVTYSGGNYSMFVNGAKINSASLGTFSSILNKIEFAQGNGGNPFAGDARQTLVFPTALTDQEAIDLTTL